MNDDLFVLRKHIFYFLFWWNIWRSMMSDTRLFRVLLLKSKLMQFSYTCVDWIKRSQDNLFICLLLKKFIVCRTFFCFFNFLSKNLEHVASNIHHFSDFEVILKYSQSFDIFCGQTIKRNLKLLKSCERWIV